MSNWTAASSDCSRPANNYVRVNTVDLYTPNARFTPERLGYQVLTLFGKLGYSRIHHMGQILTCLAWRRGPSSRSHGIYGPFNHSQTNPAEAPREATCNQMEDRE